MWQALWWVEQTFLRLVCKGPLICVGLATSVLAMNLTIVAVIVLGRFCRTVWMVGGAKISLQGRLLSMIVTCGWC